MTTPQSEGMDWSRLFGGGKIPNYGKSLPLQTILEPEDWLEDDPVEEAMRNAWFWSAPSPYASRALGNKLTPYFGQMNTMQPGMTGQPGYCAIPTQSPLSPITMPATKGYGPQTSISVSHVDDNGNAYRLSVSGANAETLAKGLAAYAVLLGNKDVKEYGKGDKKDKGYADLASAIKNYLGEPSKAARSDPYSSKLALPNQTYGTGRSAYGRDVARNLAAYRSMMGKSGVRGYGGRGGYGPRSAYARRGYGRSSKGYSGSKGGGKGGGGK